MVERFSLRDNESSNLFHVTDTNGDGKMTFAEWRDSAVRSSFGNDDMLELSRQWAKYDTANVGYLTENEAVNHRA